MNHLSYPQKVDNLHSLLNKISKYVYILYIIIIIISSSSSSSSSVCAQSYNCI